MGSSGVASESVVTVGSISFGPQPQKIPVVQIGFTSRTPLTLAALRAAGAQGGGAIKVLVLARTARTPMAVLPRFGEAIDHVNVAWSPNSNEQYLITLNGARHAGQSIRSAAPGQSVLPSTILIELTLSYD
jgi:hypothetical protein